MSNPSGAVIHELHGGINDGLQLPNTELYTVVAAPADIVLRGLKDYVEWRPTAGTTVDIYQYVPPARPDAERPGVTVHHLYLRRTEILTETVTR